jgi:uncharacterized repeat protein (TIGR01451 family)
MIRNVLRWTSPRWVAAFLGVLATFQLTVGLQAAEPGKKLLKVNNSSDAAKLVGSGGRVVEDYGGFQLIEVEAAVSKPSSGAQEIVDSHLIRLNAGQIDTSVTQPARAAASNEPGKRLFLVQFVGPIKGLWADDIRNRGGQIISYIPENTYLVYGEPAAFGVGQTAVPGTSSPVQWQGELSAGYKLRAMPMVSTAAGGSVPSTAYYSVQMVDDAQANAATMALVDQIRSGPVLRDSIVLHYRNLTVPMTPDAAAALALRPEVISVMPYVVPHMLGERQSLILSGNIDTNNMVVPLKTNYYDWLALKGFSNTAPFDFAVDVTDSGIDNGTQKPGHFGLYPGGDLAMDSRVVYNRLFGFPNTNSTLEGCDGHGTINAHIIGGWAGPFVTTVTNESDPTDITYVTNRVGFPYQDSEDFFYGRGIAPNVLLGSSVIFDSKEFTFPNYTTLIGAAYDKKARVSANSWGADTFGVYSADDQEYDALVRDAKPGQSGNQEMIIVFAAGNSGFQLGTVGSPGGAKNVITVGASKGVQSFGGEDNSGIDDSNANNADDVVFFSSRGPTSDGRHKPDIMAPGTHISGGVAQKDPSDTATNGAAIDCFDGSGVSGGLATNIFFPAGQEFYTASSGTSQATPGVAGAAALIYQYFQNLGSNAPSPALTKGILMNSARYMRGEAANDDLWSDEQGMGMVNLGTALIDTNTMCVIKDQDPSEKFTASGQRRVYTGFVSDTNLPFRVTLSWSDAPGSTVGAAYNNDLNLKVYVNGVPYLGNVFKGEFSDKDGQPDAVNNVESVFLPAGTMGEVAIFVESANINSDGVPGDMDPLDQDFALIACNMYESPISVIITDVATFISETNGFNNGFIDAGETETFDFSFKNVGLLDATNVVATMLTNAFVTPVTLSQDYGALSTNGIPGTNRFSFIVSPDAPCGSNFVVQFKMTDGETDKGILSFPMYVGLRLTNSYSFANSGKITFVNHGAALPFPSSVQVSGAETDPQIGKVIGVSVTLSNIFHEVPSQAVGVLANSRGQGVILFQNLGGFFSTNTYVVRFSDSAAAPISRLANGTFRPNGAGSLSGEIPATLPAGVLPTRFVSTLTELAQGDPNGEWRLLLYTSLGASRFGGGASGGYVRDGWSIKLTDRRTYCNRNVADIGVTQTATPENVLPDELVTYSISVTNRGPNPASAVNLTETLSPALSLQKVAASQGTYTISGQVLTFALGAMEVGDMATIKVIAKVIQPLDVVTVAQASLTNAVLELDSYPENNVVATGTSRSRFVANPTAILIPTMGVADPYPSSISVSGVTGVVSKVVVRINGLSHGYARDLDLLLVGPLGQKVILMSSAGPGTSINDLNLVFDDSGSVIPLGTINNGTYRPTDYGTHNTTIGGIAPAPPYATSLAVFKGVDPNGTWRLFVADHARDNAGEVLGGWSLEVFLGNNFVNDLGVTLALPASVERGNAFVVSTLVTNSGPTNATAAFVTNTVPDLVGVRSVSVSTGTYKMSGNQIIWSVGPMPFKSSASMQVTAVPTTLGSFSYSANVTSQDNDPNSANNFAQASATIGLPEGVTENPLPISIPEFGAASLYPSTITVSGITNPVGYVTVTLLGFSHSFPKDVDVLLVGPDGKKVMLMSDAGAGNAVSGLNLTFRSSASTAVPRGFLRSGTYFPADWDATADLPSPAPAGPYSTHLWDFNGTPANGVWSLYVNDHTSGDQGGISAGWILNISTEIEQPTLKISASGTDAILAWPTWATGFLLQGSSDVVGGDGWSPITNPAPVVIGEENVVTNSTTGSTMFFRLAH